MKKIRTKNHGTFSLYYRILIEILIAFCLPEYELNYSEYAMVSDCSIYVSIVYSIPYVTRTPFSDAYYYR